MNYFDLFCEVIPGLEEDERAWVEGVLRVELPDDPQDKEGWRRALDALAALGVEYADDYYWPGFQWGMEGADLLLWSDDNFSEDNLVSFIQAFIRRFRPQMVFRATIACTGDKWRVGVFGGYWLVISANRVLGGNTRQAANLDLDIPLLKGNAA